MIDSILRNWHARIGDLLHRRLYDILLDDNLVNIFWQSLMLHKLALGNLLLRDEFRDLNDLLCNLLHWGPPRPRRPYQKSAHEGRT